LSAAVDVAKHCTEPRTTLDACKQAQVRLEALNPLLKAGLTAVEARHKAWLKVLELAEKSLRARQWLGFDGEGVREARKALLPRDVKKREPLSVRDLAVEGLKRASYFVAQGHWLLSRFPQGCYEDVPGLCKLVTQEEIAANDYSLTAGRYVGVAVGGGDDDDGEAFLARMKEIHAELAELNESASELAARIHLAFSSWGE
jgi:type I restriction enzyme M protein